MLRTTAFDNLLLRRCMTNELVCPFNKVLHVRRVCMTSIVLAPGKLAVKKTGIYWGHLRALVIALDCETLGAKQSEYTARIHGGHKAAFVIEPLGVALRGNSIADKC